MNTLDTETKMLQLIATLKMLSGALTKEEPGEGDPDAAFVADLAHELAEAVYAGYSEALFELHNALRAEAA